MSRYIQKVTYNGVDLEVRSISYYMSSEGWYYAKVIAKSREKYTNWWGKEKFKDKHHVLYNSKWDDKYFTGIHNLAGFQRIVVNKVLRMMEYWMEKHPEALRKAKQGIVIETKKSFIHEL